MTQRTIKHGDWVKIVESNTEQKKQSLRKKTIKESASKKSQFPIICILLGGFIILASAWVYLFDSSLAQNQQLDVSAQNKITRYFSKQFMIGSWQFKKAQFDGGKVKVFISIPQKLAMSESELEDYIQHSLCPPMSSKLWLDINQHNLYINLFVGSPRRGDVAKCNNPNSHA